MIETVGASLDAIDGGSSGAVASRFVSTGTQDALDHMGSERELPIQSGGDRIVWRRALAKAWTTWNLAGTKAGIQAELNRMLPHLSPVVEESYTYDPGSSNWARFRIVLNNGTHPYGEPPKWGSTFVYGGGAMWGSGVAPNDLAMIRDVVRRMKPAHAKCDGLVIRLDDNIYGSFTWGSEIWYGSQYTTGIL